jgi:hypothetical protein
LYASYIEDMSPSDEYPPSDAAPSASGGENTILLGIFGIVIVERRWGEKSTAYTTTVTAATSQAF